MDTDSLVAVIRDLRTTPSRRTLTAAVASILASSTFAPALGFDQAQAKGHGKKKKKKKLELPPCALGQVECRGDPLVCCAPDHCSDSCGCCPEALPQCCSGPANHVCYDPNIEACCQAIPETGIAGTCPKGMFCATDRGGTPIGGLPQCCEAGRDVCRPGCCPLGAFCCVNQGECCIDVGCTIGCVPIQLGSAARTQPF
jgi:hypothetical protein